MTEDAGAGGVEVVAWCVEGGGPAGEPGCQGEGGREVVCGCAVCDGGGSDEIGVGEERRMTDGARCLHLRLRALISRCRRVCRIPSAQTRVALRRERRAWSPAPNSCNAGWGMRPSKRKVHRRRCNQLLLF